MHTYRYSQILSIAFPILLSTLMEQLIGMTDAAFLGRVGEVELGASALGGIYYVALFMLGLGFSIGAQILMARRNGQGLYAEIGNIFYHSLFFLLALGAVILGLSHFFSPSYCETLSRATRSTKPPRATWPGASSAFSLPWPTPSSAPSSSPPPARAP